MANNLRDCFPMLRSREDVLKKIDGEEHLKKTYYSYPSGHTVCLRPQNSRYSVRRKVLNIGLRSWSGSWRSDKRMNTRKTKRRNQLTLLVPSEYITADSAHTFHKSLQLRLRDGKEDVK